MQARVSQKTPDPPRYRVDITAPNLAAWIIIEHGISADASAALKWTIGKDRYFLRGYFKRKGWKAVIPRNQFKPAAPAAASPLPEPANPAIGVKRRPDGSLDRDHYFNPSPYDGRQGKASGRSP